MGIVNIEQDAKIATAFVSTIWQPQAVVSWQLGKCAVFKGCPSKVKISGQFWKCPYFFTAKSHGIDPTFEF